MGLAKDELVVERPNSTNQVREIPTVNIAVGKFRIRKEFDGIAVEKLSETIAQYGVLEPLIVRQSPSGEIELIAGERRFRAACFLGLASVPCIFCSLSDFEAKQVALVENIQRENLNPIELARALQALITETNLTQRECAQKLGMSRSGIAHSLRLLSLPPSVIRMIERNELSVGHAKVILSAPEDCWEDVAIYSSAGQLSVRQLEAYANQKYNAARFKNYSDSKNSELAVEGERIEIRCGSAIVKLSPKKGSSVAIEINSNNLSDISRAAIALAREFDISPYQFGGWVGNHD